MSHSIPSISEKIAEFYEKADQSAIPEDVIYHAKECILDFIGCSIGGYTVDTTQTILNAMLPKDGSGNCTVLPGGKAPADKAAFINGASCHAHEIDDSNTQSGGHPASCIIPSALAAAEEEDADGIEFIRSVIWGYDMMIRVCRGAIQENCFVRGWHPTSIFGIFGAAIAAGYIKKFDATQYKNAMGIAGGFASGNLECYADNSFTKRLNPANAADRGYNAAILALAGYVGPRWIFEGDHGFLHAYSDNYTPEKMLDFLDYSEYGLMYTSFKPYPCCRHTHAAIDSILKIRDSKGVSPEDIEKITVDVVTPAIRAVVEPRDLKYNPDNIAGAQFSLPYTAGCAALYGRVTVREFSEELLGDADLKQMMNRVEMIHTGDLDKYLPYIFAAEVTIDTKDGKSYTELTTELKGDPEVPITEPELKEKFLSLATLKISEEEAIKIYDAVFNLDKIKVKELTELIPS